MEGFVGARLCGLRPTVVSQNLRVEALSPGALAPDGHLGRVSSKGLDVLVDPPQRLPLVPEAIVGDTGGEGLAAAQETERGQPVVQAHADDGGAELDAVLDDEREVVALVGAPTLDEAAAVDPDGDGEVGGLIDAGRPDDVEVEAVLGESVAGIVGAIADAGGWVGLCGLCPVPG